MPDEATQERPSKKLLRRAGKVLIGAVFALGALLVLLLVAVGFAWYFSPSLETHQMVKMNPNVLALPQQLRDTSVADLKSQPTNVLGYSMQFPWGEVQRRDDSSQYARLMFKSGQYFEISNHRPRESQSTYARLAIALQALPSDVKWWHSRTRNEQVENLLFEKLIATGLSPGLFSVKSGDLRGFQFGSPVTDRFQIITLELFDGNDRQFQVTMCSGDPRKGGAPLTQPQINAILASIHPWPAGVPVPPSPNPYSGHH